MATNNEGNNDNTNGLRSNDTDTNTKNGVDEHQDGLVAEEAPRQDVNIHEETSRSSVIHRGNQAVSQLEQDIHTKQQGRSTRSSNSRSQQPGAHSMMTLLEHDIIAKQQQPPGRSNASGGNTANTGQSQCRWTQLERDMEAKRRGYSHSSGGGATPGVVPSSRVPSSGSTDLAALENHGVAAKNRARPPSSSTSSVPGAAQQYYSKSSAAVPGSHGDSGSTLLGRMEQDVASKNRARGGALTVPAVYTEQPTGNSQLNTLENDLIAKNRARPGAQAALAPRTTTGVGQLSTLEADIASKNRAFSTTTTGGGRADLSSLEQDVAAKNNARLSRNNNNNNNNNNNGNLESEAVVAALNASRQDGVRRDRPVPLTSGSPGSSALYNLENSVTEKSSYIMRNDDTAAQHYEPREQSRLFTNAGYNNDPYHNRENRSLHEIARLDEQIANKGGGTVQQQHPAHTDMYHDSNDGSNNNLGYFSENGGGLDPAYHVNIRRGDGGLVGLDDHHTPKPGEKGDEDELGGVEQARTDKDYSESRSGAGAGDGTSDHPPVGDMEYGDMQGELAVATAIEEEEDNSFIPAAVQFDPDAKPPLYKNRRVRLYGCVGLLFVVLVAVAAVVITQVAGKDDGPTGPTMAPTTQRDTLGIEEQLAEVFGSRYFEDPASIQSKALEWLINEDQLQLQPDAENLVQRYVMAYFYYETSQEGPWRTCNPPVGDQPDFCYFEYLTSANPYRSIEMYWHRWLSKLHECEWAGVICHSDKVTDVSLGTLYLVHWRHEL